MLRWREEDDGTLYQFCCAEEGMNYVESIMNSSIPATAQCHYTQSCSGIKTQSWYEKRHETVTQKPIKMRGQQERD